LSIGAIVPHLFVFGGVRRYLELGNCFVERGHEFTIYTQDGTEPLWLPFRGDVRRLDSLKRHEHDVVVCGSPELLDHVDRCAAKVRIFYLQIEGVVGEERIVRSGKYRVMVNSRGLARRVKRRYGVTPLDGIGGINPGLFHPIERGGRETVRVVCYGRLSKPRKGTRFVLGALRSLRRRGCAVELDLFDTLNPGASDPRIGFNPGIPCRFYLGLPQERMAAMYGAADVFVSAEHRAGWSNTTAEAAACGLPIVCTKSGTEDFAVDGVTALVVRARVSVLIARAVERLYRDDTLRRRLGEAAEKRVLDFTWDKVCARMERSFIELLETR
jgi:glycosyltransferase involved in cell wall biosynthesis